MLQVTYALSQTYFTVIHQIDRTRQRLQNILSQRVKKREVIQLMGLQTQLVYFLTSLNSNSSIMADLQHSKDPNITESQKEAIEDNQIELKQGLEMADMASEVISHVSDSYKSVMDIELNDTMKILTIFSIILAFPNIVFAFFGQNLQLPWIKYGWTMSMWVSVLLCLVSGVFLWLYERRK